MKTKILPPSESAYNPPLLIKQLLVSSQRFENENNIVYQGNQRFSYQDFNERVRRLANVLTSLGVKAGDTVAMLDWDSHRYLECYFAVPMIGAVLHTVNTSLAKHHILYTMNHSEDVLALVHEDFLPLVESFKDELTTVRNYVLITDGDDEPSTELRPSGEYEKLLDEASSDYDFADFDENSIATTFFTTGTTGEPKGVYFSHRQLVLHTLNMVCALANVDRDPLFNSSSVYMPITPMFHVHAWGIPYAATVLGVQQIYPGRYNPSRLVRLFREEGVTFSHCVPTILEMVLGCEEAEQTDFSNWKLLIGGSPLTTRLATKASELDIEIFTGYGMSETCPLLCITRIDRQIREQTEADQISYRVKAGVPTNFVELQIWDDKGNPLPNDGTSSGEIVVRAPWLTQGYLHSPQQSKELWAGGWLHTGDIASISNRGYVDIRDRVNDIIKTGGAWVSSLELENLINRHPQVESVAVVSLPDERWGERPHALIIPKNGELDPAMIKLHLSQFVETGQLDKWAVPETIDLVESIPTTSVGKVDKKRIRAQLIKNL